MATEYYPLDPLRCQLNWTGMSPTERFCLLGEFLAPEDPLFYHPQPEAAMIDAHPEIGGIFAMSDVEDFSTLPRDVRAAFWFWIKEGDFMLELWERGMAQKQKEHSSQ